MSSVSFSHPYNANHFVNLSLWGSTFVVNGRYINHVEINFNYPVLCVQTYAYCLSYWNRDTRLVRASVRDQSSKVSSDHWHS